MIENICNNLTRKILQWKYRKKRYKNVKFYTRSGIPRNCIIEIGRTSICDLRNDGCLKPFSTIRVRDGAYLKIGEKTYLNNGCMVVARERIEIGSKVLMGPNVLIFDHDHDYQNDFFSSYKTSPIIIEDNVWIGANSIIFRGTHIKRNSVIAAGSIVKGTVESNSLYYNEYVAKQKPINFQ